MNQNLKQIIEGQAGSLQVHHPQYYSLKVQKRDTQSMVTNAVSARIDESLYNNPVLPRPQQELQLKKPCFPRPTNAEEASIAEDLQFDNDTDSKDDSKIDEKVIKSIDETPPGTDSDAPDRAPPMSAERLRQLDAEIRNQIYATISREDRKIMQALTSSTTVLQTSLQATPAELGLPILPPLPQLQLIDRQKWLSDPKTVKQAKASPFWPWWHRAMKVEIKQLEIVGLWEIVPVPTPESGVNVLSGEWVFKLKLDADGHPLKFTARWVARGFQQQKHVDYEETVASTGRYETLRVLLAVIAKMKLFTGHVDVGNAYLNAPLKEKLHMYYPDGFEEENLQIEGMVCLLERSLHGLEQSAVNRFNTIGDLFLKKGFIRSKADPCLYSQRSPRSNQDGGNTNVTYIFVYADDVLIAASSAKLVNETKALISTKWTTTDLGPLQHYLSIKVTHQREAGILTISQKTHIDRIAKKAIGPNAPVGTESKIVRPLTPLAYVPTKETEKQANPRAVTKYQSDIGFVDYGNTATRPDLALAVSILSQFLANPNEEHQEQARKALAYAGRTSHYTITYTAGDNLGLWGHVDASYGSCDEMKSRTGYVFFFAGGPISWKSEQQSSTAKSSAEAEYMALSTAGSEALWLRRLIHDLVPQTPTEPTPLFSDSQAALSMTVNPKNAGCTKHSEVYWHWIREQIERKKISLHHTKGTENLADGLTKPLASRQFKLFVAGLKLTPDPWNEDLDIWKGATPYSNWGAP
ncbi:hypothetical protein LT330_010785 [Penicillium expansum]|nr:hypothetical protein LT330_010785 [Penicillium expansum]